MKPDEVQDYKVKRKGMIFQNYNSVSYDMKTSAADYQNVGNIYYMGCHLFRTLTYSLGKIYDAFSMYILISKYLNRYKNND